MRVGTLNNCCASLHATRFVSSLCVTAIMRSQSSIPASRSTEGCAALPSTVRRSSRSCRLRSLAPSMSTTVMSLASDTRLSATVEPTWPAPRITIFTTGTGAKKDAFYAELVFPRALGARANLRFRSFAALARSVFFSPCEDTERLELPVQVRTLQAAALGDARDGSVRLCEVMLEVVSLEGLARFP